MPSLHTLLVFAAASALLVLVPGPSVLFVVGRSIALGRRAGLLSVLGNALGTVPAVLAVALGVGAVVATSVTVLTAVKIAGAGYLVWLGVQAVRHRGDHAAVVSQRPTPARVLLRQGFVVGVTNPKTVAFFVAVLPQFVRPGAGPAWSQLLVLGLVFQLVALTGDAGWACAAGAARRWFGRSPRRMTAMAGAGGAMMVGLGGALAVSATRS